MYILGLFSSKGFTIIENVFYIEILTSFCQGQKKQLSQYYVIESSLKFVRVNQYAFLYSFKNIF